MTTHWLLFTVEAILASIAIVITLANYHRRTPGWRQVLLIIPWLLAKVLYSLSLLSRSIFGERPLQLTSTDETITFLLLIAGPTSVAILLGIRLWKSG